MNKNILKIVIIFLLISFFLFFNISCNKKPNNNNTDENEGTETNIKLDSGEVELKFSENMVMVDRTDKYKSLRIVMIPPRSPDDVIRFKFNMPMADANKLSKADIPRIDFVPEIKGKYTWKTGKELIFKPDNELKKGQYYTVKVDHAVPVIGEQYSLKSTWTDYFTVHYFQMANKVANWQVVKGNPRFVALLNYGYRKIGQGPLVLLYDQPVKVDRIKDLIEVTYNNFIELEAEIYQPDSLVTDRFETIDTKYVICVKVLNLPSNNEKVNIKIPSWDENGKQITYIKKLKVEKNFRITSVDLRQSSDNLVPQDATVIIYFNSRFDYPWLREVLKISPSPISMRIGGYSYISAMIKLKLEPGTDYNMYIEEDFTDVLGNPLEEKLNIGFKSKDLKPVLELPFQPVLLETENNKLPIKVRNVENLKYEIFIFRSIGDYIKALNTKNLNPDQFTFLSEIEKHDIDYNEFEKNKMQFFDLGIDKEKGLKLVRVEGESIGTESKGIVKSHVLVQFSNIGVTAKIFDNNIFAWVTHINNAQPYKNVKIEAFDKNGRSLGTGTTDNYGAVTIPDIESAAGSGLKDDIYLVVKNNDDVTVARLINDELSNAWQFSLPGVVIGAEKLKAAIFTERGVYRPGEKVHIKIITKKDSVSNRQITLQIKDPKGQKVVNAVLDLDDYHSTEYELKLKDEASVGEYLIDVSSGVYNVDYRFQVEEYRVPTFLVKVSSEQDKWKIDSNITANIKAEYLHGGNLSGRAVRWKLFRYPEIFKLSKFPGYKFGVEMETTLEGLVSSGEKILDGMGEYTVNFKTNHPASAGLMRYTFEASVTDIDRQNYAGRVSKYVHPSSFYIGVQPPKRAVMMEGEKLEIPIIVVDHNGKTLPDIRLEARLIKIDYHKSSRMSVEGAVQTQNREVPYVTDSKNIKSSNGAVSCTFDLVEAGYYMVEISSYDRVTGNDVKTTFKITAAGQNTIAWPRFDKEQIEIVADKETYKAGETAKLVIQSPYKNAYALLTIEQDRVLSHKIIKINDNTPVIKVPIIAEYAPNVYASIVLIRGRVHNKKDASGYETGAPGLKLGYVDLKVDPDNQKLKVIIEPGSKTAGPGDKMKIKINVKDYKNEPAACQATVMVVDEAVLSLTGYMTPDPLKKIYSNYPLGVKTGSSILDLPHSRRSRKEKIFSGGDDDSLLGLSDFPFELRNLFKSTAYWNPNLQVDTGGEAVIEFELPDNLTTYRTMVIVSDKDSRLGTGDEQIMVKKPLMIQPVLPRFSYPGDDFQIEAIVFNNTGRSEEVKLIAEVEGLDLKGEKILKSQVKNGESYSFIFKVKAVKAKEAVIRFKAAAGNKNDAAEYRIPIYTPGNDRIIVKSEIVNSNKTLTIDIPEEHLEKSVVIEAVTSSTVLSELKDSVQYLMRYPYGCIEQTTSTAYPLVVLKDLLPEMGIEVDMEELKKMSEAGVKRILSFQTSTGGLSYWPGGSKPHAFATAFGLTALIEAKKNGYDVPDNALAGMADYLETSLRQGKISGAMPHGGMADGDTRALFVMTLGRLGRPQPGYISTLWQKKDELTAFGLSFLAIAVKEMPGDQSLLKPILAEVKKRAEEEEKEAYFSGNPKGGWSFDSPLRTHGSALIAFSSVNEEGGIASKLLTGLLKRRTNGLWGNTQENVFGIMGVHQLASGTAGNNAPVIELVINGKNIQVENMEKISTRVRRIQLFESDFVSEGNRLDTVTCTLKNISGPAVYITLRAKYDLPLSKENMKAESNGFTIKRIYETVDGKSLEGKTIKLGSLVRVKLYIDVENALHYVAIDDRLPAGLEPLNTNLKTTEQVTEGKITEEALRSLSVLSYNEIRDEMVGFFVDEILPGKYEYSYVARATTPGLYLRPAAKVEAMYQPAINSKTKIDYIQIK